MTREQATEIWPLVKAYAEGQKIEYRIKSQPRAKWFPSEPPSWLTDTFEYRIKPKTKGKQS